MHKKFDSSLGMGMFGVVFDAGGFFDKPHQRGCSHLMEHLMCKTYEDLYTKMRELSVSSNACTADNSVVFFCSGLDECVEQVSQTMLDRLTEQSVLWTEKKFDNEKMVVLQEYDDAFNDQTDGSFENAIRKHYNYCGPIGFRTDIENFTYDDSLVLAKEVFSKPRKIVEVGKPSVSYSGQFSNVDVTAVPKFGHYSLELEDVPKNGQSVVGLVSKNPVELEYASKISLLEKCISFGLESPLYQEMREKQGLVYGVFLFNQVIGKHIVPCVFAETSNKKRKKLSKSYKEFFSRDMKDVLTKERFDVCKNSLLYDKKKSEILTYKGVWTIELNDFNPFEGIDDFNYGDAVDLANKLYSIDTFEPYEY